MPFLLRNPQKSFNKLSSNRKRYWLLISNTDIQQLCSALTSAGQTNVGTQMDWAKLGNQRIMKKIPSEHFIILTALLVCGPLLYYLHMFIRISMTEI